MGGQPASRESAIKKATKGKFSTLSEVQVKDTKGRWHNGIIVNFFYDVIAGGKVCAVVDGLPYNDDVKFVTPSWVDASDRDDYFVMVAMNNIKLAPKEIMYYRQASNKWDSQFKTLADGVINTQTNQMQAQQYNNYAAHQPRHRLAEVSNAAAPEGLPSCAVTLLLLIVGLLCLLYAVFVKSPKGRRTRTLRTERSERSVIDKKAPVFLR